MMSALFLTVLNMSIGASFVIVAVMLARLPLRRVPKVISHALWAVVGLRLVVPLSFESVFSLMPVKSQPIPHDIAWQQVPLIDSGLAAVDNAINSTLPATTAAAGISPLQGLLEVCAIIWLVGMVLMVTRGVCSTVLLRRRLRTAVVDEADDVFVAEGLKTPFVLGIFRPRIYLPVELEGDERRYVIVHEQTHIRRGDHIVRLCAYGVLCLHWFNPLVWVAFLLMGVDMEMSCDERALARIGGDVRRAYSLSLLNMASQHRVVGASPLAFSEGGFSTGSMKRRIRNVLDFKKCPRAKIVAAVVLVAVLTLGFTASRVDANNNTATGYQVNAAGQTYGNALDAPEPVEGEPPPPMPDLIQAQATNGKMGYIYKSPPDEQIPSNPEEAGQLMAQYDAESSKIFVASIARQLGSDSTFSDEVVLEAYTVAREATTDSAPGVFDAPKERLAAELPTILGIGTKNDDWLAIVESAFYDVQEAHAIEVPVYEADGVTVIGSFKSYGYEITSLS
jgi:beta-lactamase regulating signal transducer with metallopeptidase domain